MSTVAFRTIDRFPGYRFGSDGSIWSALERGEHRKMRVGQGWKKLKPTIGSRGYLVIDIRSISGTKKQCLVHRLILEAFFGPAPKSGMEACHFPDIDRTNNAITNLRWGTRSENHHDKWIHGTMPHGSLHVSHKLSETEVLEIRKLYSRGIRQVDLARQFGVGQTQISNVVTRKSWSWLAEEVA